MQETPPHCLKHLQKLFWLSLEQCELLNFLQRVQTALPPILDLPRSTFSKIADFIFDVLEKVDIVVQIYFKNLISDIAFPIS